MSWPKTAIVRFLLPLLISIVLLPEAAVSSATCLAVLVGEDPDKDANPASVDILAVYLMNNGTYFTFIIECRATPAPSLIRSYVVWLNTTNGDAPDYCLVAGGISGLYEVHRKGHSIKLKYKAPIEVTIEGKSIFLTANLDDIDYPGGVGDPVGVVVTTQQPLFKVRDRAPDSGMYYISHKVIPELPGPTLFLFIPSVIITVYVIYTRKFKTM